MNIKMPVFVLAVLMLVSIYPAYAQQAAKVQRIGFVSSVGNANAPGPYVEAFRQGLRDLGYIEGKNILLELRYAEGKPDRYPSLVAELVQLKVDLLVLRALPAIRAAMQATKTIPIVMSTTQDPVAAGFIASLARPGGNVTGVTTLQRELSGKRLELLKEAVPGISRVGALLDVIQLGKEPGQANDLQWYEAPARALKIELQPLVVQSPNPDFEGVFQAAAKGRASALITITSSLLGVNAKRIADLAIKNRLPSMHETSLFVEAGGLMTYASSDAESFKRAAYYVDKILKGAKPADLPVEQPTKFELVINLKAAKQIGLTIPQSVLYRADKVIK